MISITKTSGRSVLAPCFADVLVDRGTALSSASLIPGSAQGLRKPVSGLRGLVSERPIKAPAAAAAAHAYAFACAAANGAEAGPEWAGGFTAPRATAVTQQQHHVMRAFRGLEPWRDPA